MRTACTAFAKCQGNRQIGLEGGRASRHSGTNRDVLGVSGTRRLLSGENFEDLAFATKRISRALTSGAYRRRTIPLLRDDAEGEDADDDLHVSIETRALQKPYFEVLIVDQVTDYQERYQRQSLLRLRRDEDPFIYESVVTPSVEDALIAVLFNHNIQAVVVRPGLKLK